jgi:predicted amidophosphoribosyltransferase
MGTDKFCYKCGNELAQNDRCDCGRILNANDKFCPDCGEKIAKKKER